MIFNPTSARGVLADIRVICLFLLSATLLLYPIPGASQTAFTISTVAGIGSTGNSGNGGPAINATFNQPRGVATDASGNVYIADVNNNVIRRIATDGKISIFAGTGSTGSSGDGGPATSATLNQPFRVEADKFGNVYIADSGNNRVRKVDSKGIITTFAGNGNGGTYSGDGGPATQAPIGPVADCFPDAAGNVFVAASYMVLKVNSSGVITRVAGTGVYGYSGDGGPATQAMLSIDAFVVVDSAGDLYICDQSNNRIRKVSNGIITTFAGNGTAGFSGDGGSATTAALNSPSGLYLDANGNLFIADGGNYRVRVVSAAGIITTIAGSGGSGFGGDGGPATSAMIDPHSLAASPAGGLYFADTANKRIRLLTPVKALGPPSITAVFSATGFGGFSSITAGTWVEVYGTNLAQSARSWARTDFQGDTAPITLDGTSVTIDGQNAFVSYISETQINVQAPSGLGTGQRSLVVSNSAGSSASFSLNVNAVQPGLLAPPSFLVGGNQYAAALFADNLTFVLPPNAVTGAAARRAKPGDVIVFYGVGFGPVVPTNPAGQIARQSNALVNPLQIFIGGVPASVEFYGLVADSVGLYQFNVAIPNVPAGDLTLVTFTLNSVAGAQKLYIAVQN